MLRLWIDDYGEWEYPDEVWARFEGAWRKDRWFDHRKKAGLAAKEFFMAEVAKHREMWLRGEYP